MLEADNHGHDNQDDQVDHDDEYQNHLSWIGSDIARNISLVTDAQTIQVRRCCTHGRDWKLLLYRVFFLTGAPPKSSKYKKVTLG